MLKGTAGRRLYLDRLRRDVCRDWWLYAMLLPGLVYIIIFKYLPMYGVTIAFKNYSIFKGYADSPWCGMENFIKLFSRADFIRALENNIIISVEKLIFGFPTPIILSLMINEVRHRIAKKGIQTAVILPNFISWIVINGLLYAMFSTTSGVIVGLMRTFGLEGPVPNILADKNSFRAVILISYLWKSGGFGTVVAASASGRTPYCISALDYALSLGCGRVALVCNRDSEMARHADVAIEVDTGAEVIMGSTRMKAGTAQKMVMNMLSTAVMVRMGRTYDNLMIMIKARNTKANHRMLRLFSQAVGDPDLGHAREMLAAADGDLSLAVLMELTGFSRHEVQSALEAQHGHFDRTLQSLEARRTSNCKTG